MNKKATIIYNQQNKIIHCALSDLTLGERDLIIRHYQKKGLKLFKPFINRDLKDWQKGDPEMVSESSDRPLSVPTVKKRLVGKIGAILADMKLPWKYADGISNNMFKIRFVEWCSPDQLHKVVAAMVINQRRRYA